MQVSGAYSVVTNVKGRPPAANIRKEQIMTVGQKGP